MNNIPEKAQWPGWETVRLIGRGSFGGVYEIQRQIFDETEKAALKVISIPQNSTDIDDLYSEGYNEESITNTFKDHLKSIVSEYSLMRKLNGCANIVNCDDMRYVQQDNGYGWDIFIKMELLTPMLKALPAQIPEQTVIQMGKDLCSALDWCKRYNIIHRDIKPQNIFVSDTGAFKLGDFGIAKISEKTAGGTRIGTYKYIAPEVFFGKPYGSAADIYSLGLTMYWMLNERRMPFLPLPPKNLTAGMEEESRRRRLQGDPLPAPRNGSEKLKAIVLKACAFDPKDRYQSAWEMLEELNALDGPVPRSVSYVPAATAEPETEGTVLLVGEETHLLTPEADATGLLVENEETGLLEKAEETALLTPEKTQASRTQLASEQAEIVKSVSIPKEEGNTSVSQKSKKKLPAIIGAALVALVAVVVVLLTGLGKNGAGTQDNAGNQATDIPAGTKLAEGTWENGSITVVALFDTTLWIQVTDNRPEAEYEDLGTLWDIQLNFGAEMRHENESGGYAFAYPYVIGLVSMASRAAQTHEYEQGNVSEFVSTDDLKTLLFKECEDMNDVFRTKNESRVDYIIERDGNTYTAVIKLPDWFDVSLASDLTKVEVFLYKSSFYADLYQNGSASFEGVYSFDPINP